MAGACRGIRSPTQATTIGATHPAHRRQLRRVGALTGRRPATSASHARSVVLQPSPEKGTFSMPTYTHNTPTPIDLAINWQVGAIEIIAADRGDTIVTVVPTNA